jgi:hypothetical protein
MGLCKFFASLTVTGLFFVACSNKNSDKEGSSTSVTRNQATIIDSTITKFCLAYPKDLMLDSNSLVFYCARTFDTSSLIHIQKNNLTIRGVYYEMLPAYHQFPNDFADQKNDLLFFDGYSFVIDSAIWRMIKERVNILLQTKDSLTKNREFVDGSRYAIYYNSQSRFGDNNQEALYENFYDFLKRTFLKKIIQSRKPRSYKTNERRDSLPSE